MINPLQSDSPLIVYVDIKSPYAFVAIKPILAMEARLGIHIDWRPLTLDIPSYLGSAKKSKGKVVSSNRSASQWAGIKYAYKDARRYVERQGYILKGTEKIWDSSIANIGILWVCANGRAQLPEYFEAVYPQFWQRDLDIEDVAVVQSCIEQANVDATGFAAYQHLGGQGRVLHDQLQNQLHPAGIYGVPTFVFGDHVMFGREHLPFVEWWLAGQSGSPPDIAYTLE